MINKYKINILILNILIFISSYSFSQVSITEDSLNKLNDTVKLNKLVGLCWDYRIYEPLKSFKYGIEGIMLAKMIDDNLKLAKLNNYLGLLYRNINVYDYALNYFKESYSIADSLNLKTEKAYALNNMGNVYYLQQKFEKSSINLHKALAIFKDINNKIGLAYCYNQIGLLHFEKKEYERSIKNHLQALKIRKIIDNKDMISTSLFYIAKTYIKLGQYDKAEIYLAKRIKYLESIKNKDDLANTYLYLANTYKYLNNDKNELEYYNKAFYLAKKHSMYFSASDAANKISKFYWKKNDLENALKYFKIYNNLNDSTNKQNLKESFINLDTKIKFELRLNKMTNTIKQKEKIHQLEIEKQKRVILFFIAFFTIFLIFMLYIYQSSKNIKEKNKALEQQKLNIIEINEEINIKNEELEEINITKDKFFSIIAHDLKNPFNSMLGLSEMLIKGFDDFEKTEQKDFINLIHKGLHRNYNLLENLLLWASEQRGVLEFNLEKENLYLISSEIISELAQTKNNKLINLINKIPEDIFVKADKNMLLIILRNLISNAIKFTQKNGDIEIGCNEFVNENIIKIYVKDSGIGMTKKRQAKLFDISENISSKGTENETGTGLGLIICKEFIEKHKGEIGVESEIGKGSTFWFTLPVST